MSDNSESVRVVDWLASRLPPAPSALFDVINGHVGEASCTADDLPVTLVDIASRILGHLGEERDSANDLLAADALVTYAIEAAAEAGGDVASFSRDAAVRLSQSGVKA